MCLVLAKAQTTKLKKKWLKERSQYVSLNKFLDARFYCDKYWFFRVLEFQNTVKQ